MVAVAAVDHVMWDDFVGGGVELGDCVGVEGIHCNVRACRLQRCLLASCL